MSIKSGRRIAVASPAVAVALFSFSSMAQQADPKPATGAATLPPVTVEAPNAARKRQTTTAPRSAARTSRATRSAASRNLPEQAPPSASAAENPRGPIRGYVANRSATGTKTNTPLNETPQSISVVGQEQIRDQRPTNVGQAISYTPGVFGQTFGNDTRSEFFQIRGFPAEQSGLFLDGLQLFSTSFATFKLQPFGLERIEVLRGPASVLYGGTNAGGIVNALSKLPPSEPIRYIEGGVDSYGNRFVGFDFGGPVAIQPQDGQLSYRLVGLAKNGDTQVKFTPNDSFYIAPSVTYRPDLDTTITVLAQASKDETRGIAFLPYTGTVVPAAYGRIPTNFFAGDPTVDRFSRGQALVGYQIERNVSDSLTVRQNARFAHTDVFYSSLIPFASDNAGNLTRGNFFANSVADQGTVDTQAEWRVQTGALQHKVLFGVDYKNYGIHDYTLFAGGAPPINVLNPVYGQGSLVTGPPGTYANLTQSQTGVYLQDQIKLDRLTVVVSGRNDWVSELNYNLIGASQARDDSKASGRAGVIYDLGYGLSPYVSYATYFNPIPGVNSTLGNLYLPETGTQSEAGLKWQPGNLDGHIDFAYFDIKRQNVISVNPASVFQTIQSAELTSRGYEVSVTANLTRDFKILASYTGFRIFNSSPSDPVLLGKPPVNTPSQFANFYGDYTSRTGWWSGFGIGGGVRYVGNSYTSGGFGSRGDLFIVPAYTVGDVAVHYEWSGWRAAVNVFNVGDKTYVASCAGLTSCFYGERRRALATLSYRW